MKYLGALWLAFVILCCSVVTGCKPAQVPATPSPDDFDSATVGLVRPDEDGQEYVFCAAEWIGPNTILTAAHCADAWNGDDVSPPAPPAYATKKEAGQVDGPIKTTHGLKIVDVNHVADLALLYVDAPSPHVSFDIAFFEPSVGEHVYIVGHPAGLVWSHYEGVIAAYRTLTGPEPIEGSFMQVSAPIYFGNSGGPCLDSDGKLVGVASFMMGRVPSVGFFVDLGTIQRFVRGRNL